MGGEIITIHLGQAGVQISHALWELVCVEHGITAEGRRVVDAEEHKEEECGREYVFREVSNDKFVPRALLVDLEPSVVDEVKCGAYRDLWHPQQLITGKEDAASNFARGYYSQARFEMNEVMERIRVLVEQCECLSCFKLLYSANGGTGSGLTSALCERLSDEYGKKYKFATTVYPSPGYSELMVEPYNALLHSSTNLTFCDCVVLMDNEAMLNVVEDCLRQNHGGFTIPNRMIANAVTTQFLSHRYRFVGQQHAHVSELLINLIPYPRIHFPMMAFAPFLSPECRRFEKCTPMELVRSVFEDTNQLLSVSALRRAYISCALLFRGPITPLEAINAVTAIKADRMSRARFVDWCPTGFKLGVNFAPPLQAAPNNTLAMSQSSLTMIAGNLSIRDVWTGIGRRFDQLYQKRAYVHWYVAEGMEEGEFTLAREVIQQLVDDYEAIAKDAEGTTMDSSVNYTQEQPVKSIMRATPRANRSPLNPTEANINQATTLDDQNSLHTMENNDDAISLDTNQHHSNSVQADAYQVARVRLNESDDAKVDWRSTKAVSGTHARKADAMPNMHPIRKRRLRFPEISQKSTGLEEAYRLERNQNGAQGLSVLARSGTVYGTNCSAAVTQQGYSLASSGSGAAIGNEQKELLHVHGSPTTQTTRRNSTSLLTPVIEEQSINQSYDLQSTRNMENAHQKHTISEFQGSEILKRTYSSPQVRCHGSIRNGSMKTTFCGESQSPYFKQSQKSTYDSESRTTSQTSLVDPSCSQITRPIKVYQQCTRQEEPGDSPPDSHSFPSRPAQSYSAESVQGTLNQLDHDDQFWRVQASSANQPGPFSAESDISPPQITPLRSPLASSQHNQAVLSHTTHSSLTRSQNMHVGPFACCPQLRRHRHTQRERHHAHQHQHHHHHHHRHHNHHHHHPHHHQRRNHAMQNQYPQDSHRADSDSRYQTGIVVEEDELIGTSNDVSEITVRSSKSLNPDRDMLYPESYSAKARGAMNPDYAHFDRAPRGHVSSNDGRYTTGTDEDESSHTAVAEDRSYRPDLARCVPSSCESFTPTGECHLYPDASQSASSELHANGVYSTHRNSHPSEESGRERARFVRNYHHVDRSNTESLVMNKGPENAQDVHLKKFRSTALITLPKQR